MDVNILCNSCNRHLNKEQGRFCSITCTTHFMKPCGVKKVCANCHVELKGREIFCSDDCEIIFAENVNRCAGCEDPIRIRKTYCTRACMHKSLRRSSEERKQRTHCMTCNEPLTRGQKIYCSYSCVRMPGTASESIVDPNEEEIRERALEIRMKRDDFGKEKEWEIPTYRTKTSKNGGLSIDYDG